MKVPTEDELVAAVSNVVAYSWADEERDYEEQEEDGREAHIFRDLQTLQCWLDTRR